MPMNAGRRHAVPMLSPVSGLPLIKSAPSLGYRAEWRKANIDVQQGMSDSQRKRRVKWGVDIFLDWMKKEGAEYLPNSLSISGPFPHFDPHHNDTQFGDNGAHREVARSIVTDTTNDKEDYVIEACFKVREAITEIPTSLALELFGKSGQKSDIRPLREREWKNTGDTIWQPR